MQTGLCIVVLKWWGGWGLFAGWSRIVSVCAVVVNSLWCLVLFYCGGVFVRVVVSLCAGISIFEKNMFFCGSLMGSFVFFLGKIWNCRAVYCKGV